MTFAPPHPLVGAPLVLATFLNSAVPATAQFLAQPANLPIGENSHVELFAGTWSPTPAMSVASGAFGISGTYIDLTRDLAVTPDRFTELRLRLRPGRRHRFRIDYLPVNYAAETIVERRLVFRGIAYDVGEPVRSTLIWKTLRLGYEYDVVHRRRGHFGVILEAKYTELETALGSSSDSEFVRARGPIPALGAVLRLYPLSTLSVAAEVTAIRLPNNVVNDYSGRYVDVDFYATMNFIESLGLQIGYRSLDLSLVANEDIADLRLAGIYLGALLRF